MVGGPPNTAIYADRSLGAHDGVNPTSKQELVLSRDIPPSQALSDQFSRGKNPPLLRASYLHLGHTRGHRRSPNYVFIKAEIEHINKMEIGFTECSKSGRFGRRSLARHHSHKPTHKIHTIKMENVTKERITNKIPGNKPLMSSRGSLIKKISTNKSFILVPFGNLASFVFFCSVFRQKPGGLFTSVQLT